jgi:hypothetical protein
MKKKSYLRLCFLPLLFMIVALSPACKKNNDGGSSAPPVIAAIKSYVASPNDTVLHNAVAKGQWVVITGQNLQNATQIYFDGVPASFNTALFAPGSAVVQIPAIQFGTIDTAKLYTVKYVTGAGSATFAFKLGPAAPTISAVSDVFAAPGDSVYLYGANLVLVQQFSYGGTKIPKFNSNANGTSLGFLMPATTSNKLIIITTKSGTVRDTINAKPIIAGVSNDNANVGDSVYVYGIYLKTIQSVSFGGATITNFTEDPRGSYVKFLAPASNSYSSGPVTIVTSYGTVSTPYKVNTQNGVTDGLLANFEWGDNFGYQWWGDITLASNMADFNGSMGTNSSQYVYFNSPVLDGGASKYAPLGNSNTGNHWVPVANLTDTVSHWALQFEISVAHPWNGGTLYIRTELAKDSYVARYEPWKIPNSNKTVAFKTKGWQTVTIPLSDFRSKVKELGDGESVTQLNQLLGPTGANSYNMTLKNFDTSPTATGFYAAIDNIRCVKIK